jgi:hypothetical protein
VEYGGPAGIALLTNFLPLRRATCVGLLEKMTIAEAGRTRGNAEFVPNEDRVSPPMAAAFSMVMPSAASATRIRSGNWKRCTVRQG